MRTAVIVALGLTILAGPAFAAGESCRDLVSGFLQASKAGSLEGMKEAYGAVFDAPDCTDKTRNQIAAAAAAAHLKEVKRRLDSGETLDSLEPLLTRTVGFGRPWQALALLADLRAKRAAYTEAATLYIEALNVIRDEAKTPAAPPKDEIEALLQRANEMRLLAKDYVASIDRAGVPDGVVVEEIRGFKVESVPMPITFVYGKAEFTPEGRRAAADLAEWLRIQRPAAVTIIGHTDPRGSDEYNDALSRSRAEAVADFVRANGYEGSVATLGAGKRIPFRPENPARYSVEERHQLDRRVELRR